MRGRLRRLGPARPSELLEGVLLPVPRLAQGSAQPRPDPVRSILELRLDLALELLLVNHDGSQHRCLGLPHRPINAARAGGFARIGEEGYRRKVLAAPA
jgi:hypothetical protein